MIEVALHFMYTWITPHQRLAETHSGRPICTHVTALCGRTKTNPSWISVGGLQSALARQRKCACGLGFWPFGTAQHIGLLLVLGSGVRYDFIRPNLCQVWRASLLFNAPSQAPKTDRIGEAASGIEHVFRVTCLPMYSRGGIAFRRIALRGVAEFPFDPGGWERGSPA